MDIRDAARDGFTESFGQPPSGLWSAPGALMLAGDPAGLSLSLAVSRRTVVSLGLRDDRMLRIASTYADEIAEIDLSMLMPDQLHGWSAYPLGIIWALGQAGADLGAVPGVDLFIESDVPVGVGLSSSAAIEMSVASALNDVWRLDLPAETLARAAQRARTATLGAASSIAAPLVSLLGKAGSALLFDGRNLDSNLGVQFVELDLRQAELALLIIDSGAGEPSTRAPAPFTAEQRLLDLVRRLREDGPAALGPALDESHQAMVARPGLIPPETDLAVDVAHANGALGARMTGSSGGAVALVPASSVSLVQVALDGAFAEHGYSPPDTYVVSASGGATREP